MPKRCRRHIPKVGTYDCPTRDLDDCLSYVKKAFETAKVDVLSREGFANAINQSVKGGGFGLLVGSMAHYGLVDTGGDQIKITELAKACLFGEADEQRKAKEKAARKVLLFADIYDRYGANPTEEQIRLSLREKAKVETTEANSLAIEVGKLLNKVVSYLTSASGEEGVR